MQVFLGTGGTKMGTGGTTKGFGGALDMVLLVMLMFTTISGDISY